jgi:hypothetical protein
VPGLGLELVLAAGLVGLELAREPELGLELVLAQLFL